MRILSRGIYSVIALLLLFAGYTLWQHNRSINAPDRQQLDVVLENSIQWLADHRESILGTQNPMLWKMIQRAGDITGDKRLTGLFSEYTQRYIANRPNNIWRPLFYPESWVPVRFENIAHLPYYNWHFIYAYTCDRDLATVPEIMAQNDPAFCDRHPLRPACVTHQMMGMLLLRNARCGDPETRDATIEILQERILSQLTWDPRIVDVTMQRVLMLVDSGAAERVKPVWLHRLIDAQQQDGGWSPFMPLLPLGGGKWLVLSNLPSIGAPISSFHMTAQGVLLFTLLTHPQS